MSELAQTYTVLVPNLMLFGQSYTKNAFEYLCNLDSVVPDKPPHLKRGGLLDTTLSNSVKNECYYLSNCLKINRNKKIKERIKKYYIKMNFPCCFLIIVKYSISYKVKSKLVQGLKPLYRCTNCY